MKKVYGLKWTGNNQIAVPLFADKIEADRTLRVKNATMKWSTKIAARLSGFKWVVIEMTVKEKGD